MTDWPHISVLLQECVDALHPVEGEVVVDCTLGMGGHTEALLSQTQCTVIGLDRDEAALAIAKRRLARFGERFIPVQSDFGALSSVVEGLGLDGVDGVLADLGVSSLQLDTAERGFSFRFEGPLDMRMDPSSGEPASTLVNTGSEEDLVGILRTYGEERHARRVVRAIIAGRPWADTFALAEAVRGAIPGAAKMPIHPATRTFQALRIAVNDELGQLERLLESSTAVLKPGGRLAIISFHSLEDRMVKQFLARESGRGVERDPFGNPVVTPRYESRNRAIKPGSDDPNPRARSARLRTAVRL